MKKQYFLLMAMFLAVGLAFTACSSDDDDDDSVTTVDKRITQVIPDTLLKKVESYVTFYDGVTPPNVEGVYYLDPQVLVKSNLTNDTPGKTYNSQYHRYSNQNSSKRTIDMLYVSVSEKEYQKGSGAFISGYDDKFTIYFNCTGKNGDVPFKQAIVVSGIVTDDGVKDLQWAFVMIEKGSDPKHTVVEPGTIRSFKDSDGFSERKSEWPYGTKYDNL